MELITAVLLSLAVTAGSPAVTVEDLQVFPPRAVVAQQWEAAQEHARWVEVQISLRSVSEGDGWKAAWEDAAWRCYCWDCLLQATREVEGDYGCYAWSSNWHLQELRYRIGEFNYRHGAMPNAVPAWRMRE